MLQLPGMKYSSLLVGENNVPWSILSRLAWFLKVGCPLNSSILTLIGMVKNIESGHLPLSAVEEKLQQWLHGTSPVAGLLIIQTGEKMSLYSAAKRGFLRRGTAVS